MVSLLKGDMMIIIYHELVIIQEYLNYPFIINFLNYIKLNF